MAQLAGTGPGIAGGCMRTQQGRMRRQVSRLVSRTALGLITAVAALALVVPVAGATPESDAGAAIDQAWTAAGGDTSPLGARDGGVYAAGNGFGQNFAGGAIFYSPDTGAKIMFGVILDKYRALGGPADSDLGFPNIDEGPGKISPAEPQHHVQRGRPPGHLLDSRHRRLGGARRDQRGVGPTRRLGGCPGRSRRRRDLRRRRRRRRTSAPGRSPSTAGPNRSPPSRPISRANSAM